MARAPDPEAVEYALDALKAGRSIREIAKTMSGLGYPVTATTITRWRERAGVEPAAKPTPAPVQAARAESTAILSDLKARFREPPEEPDAFEDVDLNDLPAVVRAMLKEAFGNIRTARRAGNTNGAQKAMRDAATAIAPLLARLEKMQAADASVLRLSLSEIDTAYANMLDRVSGLVDRPLLCSKCSRVLNAEIAGLDPYPVAPEAK